MKKKSWEKLSSAILHLFCFIFVLYIFYEKIPLCQRDQAGDGDSLQSILKECHRKSFEEAIPLKTEFSYYYFHRNVTLWYLQVVGGISHINIGELQEHFKSIDSIDNAAIFSHFTLPPDNKFENIEESHKFYRTYKGSEIYLAISPDLRHYILDIRHR